MHLVPSSSASAVKLSAYTLHALSLLVCCYLRELFSECNVLLVLLEWFHRLYAMQASSTGSFRRKVYNCNTAASGLCLLLLFSNLIVFVWRVANTWRSKKKW